MISKWVMPRLPATSWDSTTVDLFLFLQRLKFEIAEVMTEIEQLTCVGER